MTTRAYRFEAQIDPKTYLFSHGYIYDELLAADPVTDVITGTGKLIGPVQVTAITHPELFTALNAQAVKCDERLTAARAAYLQKIAPKAIPEPVPVVRK